MELIDWVETQAKENLQSRVDNLEKLIADANSFLKISLAGLSAVSVYFLKIYAEKTTDQWLVYALLVTSIYLMLIATTLITKCLKVGESYPTTNEPKNLYLTNYELKAIREVELKNTQSSIDFMVARNSKIAAWLDRAKTAIIFTPVIFIFSALVVVYL